MLQTFLDQHFCFYSRCEETVYWHKDADDNACVSFSSIPWNAKKRVLYLCSRSVVLLRISGSPVSVWGCSFGSQPSTEHKPLMWVDLLCESTTTCELSLSSQQSLMLAYSLLLIPQYVGRSHTAEAESATGCLGASSSQLTGTHKKIKS